jgi:GTPase SAR1 family protein
MSNIDQIILQGVNPFDQITFYTGNFWQEQQDSQSTVDSVHQEVIDRIEQIVHDIDRDHRPRTTLLVGDSGSGKSYLLSRLKQQLKSRAFFAYIEPWADSDYIWRHTLRQTVDSLMHSYSNQEESQLLIWLKGLSAFKDKSLMKQVLGEKRLFIHNLKNSYPVDIYNPKEFFGVLYELTTELYPLACQWLRGDELDDEDLKKLKVGRTIDNEYAAQKTLSNFGRISANSQPIVLCFDQLDNIPRLIDGSIDLQALFNVNSSLHTQHINNFLVIISIITSTWKQNSKRIQPADKVRINEGVLNLRPITLDQAAGIWEKRLSVIYGKAQPKPKSSIYPLTRQALEEKFPGGKTFPRHTLVCGRQLYQEYKTQIASTTITVGKSPSEEEKLLAAFKLVWHEELRKTEQKVSRIGQFPSSDLIHMLQEVLEALQVEEVKAKVLPSKTYAGYSMSYRFKKQSQPVGLVWSEDANLNKFCNLIETCRKVADANLYEALYLIRAERLGAPQNKGYKLYRQVFTGHPNRHVRADLSSIQYLVAYHSLVNAACSRELVVADTTPTLEDLRHLAREAKILEKCQLLQDLEIVLANEINPEPNNGDKPTQPPLEFRTVREFLLNMVITQQFMGQQTLIQNTLAQFSHLHRSQVEQLIHELCRERCVQVLDPNAKPEDRLVCFVPSS